MPWRRTSTALDFGYARMAACSQPKTARTPYELATSERTSTTLDFGYALIAACKQKIWRKFGEYLK